LIAQSAAITSALLEDGFGGFNIGISLITYRLDTVHKPDSSKAIYILLTVSNSNGFNPILNKGSFDGVHRFTPGEDGFNKYHGLPAGGICCVQSKAVKLILINNTHTAPYPLLCPCQRRDNFLMQARDRNDQEGW